MDTTLSRLQVWPLWQKAKRLTVSAVHEDSATGARSEEYCQTLARCLGGKCVIAKEMWLLTELRTNQLRSIAAGEAAVGRPGDCLRAPRRESAERSEELD